MTSFESNMKNGPHTLPCLLARAQHSHPMSVAAQLLLWYAVDAHDLHAHAHMPLRPLPNGNEHSSSTDK